MAGRAAAISYLAARAAVAYDVDREIRHEVSPMLTTRLPSILPRLARPLVLATVACAALAGSAVTTPANAWCCGGGGWGWHGGVFIGVPPIVVGPPV
jgi:hypothetical protein